MTGALNPGPVETGRDTVSQLDPVTQGVRVPGEPTVEAELV